jgi:hypothetical protein
VLLLLVGCAGRAVAPIDRAVLPVSAEVQRFYDFVDRLDLADPRYQLAVRHGEGTSCYLLLKTPESRGKTWGAIVPEHGGTVIDAEIFAHTLGTLLGIGELEGPARRLWLRGRARDRVVGIVAAEDFSRDNHYRQENVREFLAHARAGGPIAAVAKIWGPPPHDADFLVRNGTLDPGQPLARFLRADQPAPTRRPMSLDGIAGQSTELELARELSSIFVMDVLLGQRDRFSGGNLQAIVVTAGGQARVRFVAYDNGDALDSDDPASRKAYLAMVSRFDRALVQRLLALNDFLGGRTSTFQDFTREAELQRALDLRWAEAWGRFKGNLRTLVAHIESVSGQKYFDD